MTITWFDRLRGGGQGRMSPQNFVAPSGEKVFVLGSDGGREEATLQSGDSTPLVSGDFTEIKQIVDLSDWDLVSATFDTIGTVMSQVQPNPSLGDPPSGMSPLWWFNFDDADATVKNLVTGGFDIIGAGDLAVGIETYSPAQTICREIPVGSTTAILNGINSPNFFEGTGSTLDNYTFQMWMNFDAVSIPSSWGVSPNFFYIRDGSIYGMSFGLSGATGGGAHSWTFNVGHFYGGSTVAVFNGPVINTPNPGWTLVTITWERFAIGLNRCLLYLNDSPTAYQLYTTMGSSPRRPATAQALTFADPSMWGMIDEMRLLGGTMSQAQIAASYLNSTTWPALKDLEWVMQIIINNEIYAERTIESTEQRQWTDFQAPVRHLTGASEVGFRLKLQEV